MSRTTTPRGRGRSRVTDACVRSARSGSSSAGSAVAMAVLLVAGAGVAAYAVYDLFVELHRGRGRSARPAPRFRGHRRTQGRCQPAHGRHRRVRARLRAVLRRPLQRTRFGGQPQRRQHARPHLGRAPPRHRNLLPARPDGADPVVHRRRTATSARRCRSSRSTAPSCTAGSAASSRPSPNSAACRSPSRRRSASAASSTSRMPSAESTSASPTASRPVHRNRLARRHAHHQGSRRAAVPAHPPFGVGDGGPGSHLEPAQYMSRLTSKLRSEEVLSNPATLYKLASTTLRNVDRRPRSRTRSTSCRSRWPSRTCRSTRSCSCSTPRTPTRPTPTASSRPRGGRRPVVGARANQPIQLSGNLSDGDGVVVDESATPAPTATDSPAPTEGATPTPARRRASSRCRPRSPVRPPRRRPARTETSVDGGAWHPDPRIRMPRPDRLLWSVCSRLGVDHWDVA